VRFTFAGATPHTPTRSEHEPQIEFAKAARWPKESDEAG
jgi:hypothetical protein